MADILSDLTQSLAEARAGSADALGRLLHSCRGYLLMVANRELDPALRAKSNPSDLVQETFMEAFRDFRQFHGTDEVELLAWLRRLLLNNLANFSRAYRETDKRDLSRERSASPVVGGSLVNGLASDEPSAATQAIQREEGESLRDCLARLPEEYRQVLDLRFQERLTFEEIGKRLGRTGNAVRKLWGRAVERLQREMGTRG